MLLLANDRVLQILHWADTDLFELLDLVPQGVHHIHQAPSGRPHNSRLASFSEACHGICRTFQTTCYFISTKNFYFNTIQFIPDPFTLHGLQYASQVSRRYRVLLVSISAQEVKKREVRCVAALIKDANMSKRLSLQTLQTLLFFR